jgi:molybdate transport system ATP-binding protein
MRLRLDAVTLPLAKFDLHITAAVEGPVTGLFGPSGAGKTSLLDVIAGLRRPSSGRVVLDETTLDDVEHHVHVAPHHRRIGYVPQENALFPHMPVLRNIRYGEKQRDEEHERHVIAVLEIDSLLDREIRTLSGGEQKRVALARALLASPSLLLLDEPLAGLDRPLHGRIIAFLERIRDDLGVPMLYVTHDADELARMATATLVIEAGRLRAAGLTRDVVPAL